MQKLLTLIGHAGDVASVIGAPLVLLPIIALLAWQQWGTGEMQRQYKFALLGFVALGFVAYAVEMIDKYALANPPTRLRLHYTANSPRPEILQSDNIYTGKPQTYQFEESGKETDDPSRIKWTFLIISFEKPIEATNLRITFEGEAMKYEIRNQTSRSVSILFVGSPANKIIDIEPRP